MDIVHLVVLVLCPCQVLVVWLWPLLLHGLHVEHAKHLARDVHELRHHSDVLVSRISGGVLLILESEVCTVGGQGLFEVTCGIEGLECISSLGLRLLTVTRSL